MAVSTTVIVGIVIGAKAWVDPGWVVGVVAGLPIGTAGGLSATAVESAGLSADPRAVLRTDRKTGPATSSGTRSYDYLLAPSDHAPSTTE